ncbi:MAG: succinate dehydrogenase iron-sulfur subunit [Planctomycetales bacterium]
MGDHASDDTFDVKVLRQDGPGKPSYWQRFRLDRVPELNVISVLQMIAAKGEAADGRSAAPVAWESNCLEVVCGACTMLVYGRTRQAFSTLVDKLLGDSEREIVLEPMSKFPVIRDLVVNRERLFRSLTKVHGWIDVDGYHDAGPGPRQSQHDQQTAYPLSQCMSCGCCMEACPQYLNLEIPQASGESDEDYQARKDAAHDGAFMGPAAISQAILFNTHPTGTMNAEVRLDALTAEGGIQVCGNAQNCVAVCPKEIPLTTSIAKAGRAATLYSLKQWFGG